MTKGGTTLFWCSGTDPGEILDVQGTIQGHGTKQIDHIGSTIRDDPARSHGRRILEEPGPNQSFGTGGTLVTMRFAARAFALCFIPVAVVLGISYSALQSTVQKSVRDQLRSAMRDRQNTMSRARSRNQQQVARMLRFAGEDNQLRAGLERLQSNPANPDARRTVQDQLKELGDRMGFKFLVAADVRGDPVAWVVRERDRLEVPETAPAALGEGLVEYRGQLYQRVSAPIDRGRETVGYLAGGDRFDPKDFAVPVVLLHDGRMAASSQPGVSGDGLASAVTPCVARPECEVRWQGADYLSVRIDEPALGPGYELRSFQNIDSAAAPVEAGMRTIFLTASIGAMLAALVVSAGASRSLVRPLGDVVSHLQRSEEAGLLVDIPAEYGRVAEVRDLIRSFNRAAASVRDARDGLHSAYVEFVGSLASALDARDRYTAGHSRRVSDLAASIAQASGLSPEEQETIRIGALLHDIGKIGIPDHVLQKPGALSEAEFALIKQHPTIGCKILEGVQGFSPYLPPVEFHHENWDGSGYPRGLKETEIPLSARIVHVADAWDAMTSDRPYRLGFSHARALSVITVNAGIHFDPEIVNVFKGIVQTVAAEESHAILQLATAMGPEGPGSEDPVPLEES